MTRRFKLRNVQMQHLATVLYFFEDTVQSNAGILITSDFVNSEKWLYNEEPIDQVIADLASRLNLEYHDYVEV